jgi:hypothetical protein
LFKEEKYQACVSERRGTAAIKQSSIFPSDLIFKILAEKKVERKSYWGFYHF